MIQGDSMECNGSLTAKKVDSLRQYPEVSGTSFGNCADCIHDMTVTIDENVCKMFGTMIGV